jgi:hypothetical protein
MVQEHIDEVYLLLPCIVEMSRQAIAAAAATVAGKIGSQAAKVAVEALYQRIPFVGIIWIAM